MDVNCRLKRKKLLVVGSSSASSGGGGGFLGDLLVLLDDDVLLVGPTVGVRGEFMERLCTRKNQIANVVCHITLDDDFIDARILDALTNRRTRCEPRRQSLRHHLQRR